LTRLHSSIRIHLQTIYLIKDSCFE